MDRIKVRNTPSPRLMDTIGATNQTTPEAIGELVANSFDARCGSDKLNIVVAMKDGKISVVDDGTGMTEQVLEKAIRIAEDMSRYMTRSEGAKGHFGMGLKTSCATLGTYYEIFTRPTGGSQEFHVAFDLADYARRASGENAWDTYIDSNDFDESDPLGSAKHGTAVVVSRLRDENASVSAVLSYLGEAFKGHIKTGDKISVVDDSGIHCAQPKKEDLIQGTRVEIDTVCGPNGSYHISGWVGLDKKTHNDGNYGFNIYRNNQLVEKWDKSWFRAHLMTSRIVGEVNLDFLDATFYKQGLQQSEVWKIVKAHMTEYLRPIVKASNSISKSHNIDKPTQVRKIVSELRTSYNEPPLSTEDNFQNHASHDASSEGTRFGSNRRSGVHDTVQNLAQEHSLSLQHGDEHQIIDITYAEKNASHDVKAPFDYIFEDGDNGEHSELQVILYLDHPLWQGRKADQEIIKILATSDAIYRMLVDELEYDSHEAFKIRNEWVWSRSTSGNE